MRKQMSSLFMCGLILSSTVLSNGVALAETTSDRDATQQIPLVPLPSSAVPNMLNQSKTSSETSAQSSTSSDTTSPSSQAEVSPTETASTSTTKTGTWGNAPVSIAELVIKYVDDKGNKLQDPVTVTGNVGDAVDLTKYETFIKGYSIFSKDKDVTELTDQDQTVTLTYKHTKAHPLVIKYVDDKGNRLQDPVTVTGNVGDAVDLTKYETFIKGYTIFSKDKDVTELTDQDQTVTLTYKHTKAHPLVIKYVDDKGNKLQDSVTVTGNVGDAVDLTKYESFIKGYTIFSKDKDVTELTDQDQTVIFTYKHTKAHPLVIKYVDDKGNKLQDSVTVTGNVGDAVDLTKYETFIKGYSIFSKDKDVTELTDQDQTVTLTYKHTKAHPLVIKYVDDKGNELQDPVTVTGNVGDAVELTKYETAIKGFTFDKADKDVTELTDQDQTVTLTYKHTKAHPLVIKYVDDKGNKLQDPVTVTGNVGDAVDLTKYETFIKGYTIFSKDKDVTELTDQDQTVTFTYIHNQAKPLTFKYVDQVGNQLADDKVVNGFEGDQVDIKDYETALTNYTFDRADKAVTELTDQDQIVTLTYTHNPAKPLTIKYVDQDGNQLADDKVVNGFEGDQVDIKDYETALTNYSFDKADKDVTELTDQDQTVTLTYTHNPAKPLTIKYVDQDGNQLADDKVVNGFEGDQVDIKDYETALTNYSFDKADKDVTELTDQDQIVTLTYTQNERPTPNPDNNGGDDSNDTNSKTGSDISKGTLPSTGESNSLWMTLAGISTLLTTSFALVLKRKRK